MIRFFEPDPPLAPCLRFSPLCLSVDYLWSTFPPQNFFHTYEPDRIHFFTLILTEEDDSSLRRLPIPMTIFLLAWHLEMGAL